MGGPVGSFQPSQTSSLMLFPASRRAETASEWEAPSREASFTCLQSVDVVKRLQFFRICRDFAKLEFRCFYNCGVLFKWEFINQTRDLPGDALVFKRKYNLEKGQKWQYWNIFQWALKIWEITASFISFELNHQENTLFFFIAASILSYEC